MGERIRFGVAMAGAQVEEIGDHPIGSSLDRYYSMNAERLASDAPKKLGGLPVWSSIKDQAVKPEYYVFGDRARHREYFETDFSIAEELGVDVIRTSASMHRVIREDGSVNRREIDFLKKMVEKAKEKGIEIVLTAFHWDLPTYLEDKGGFLNPETSKHFLDYVDVLGRELADVISCWVTINEPMVYVLKGYFLDDFPPGGVDTVFKKIRNIPNFKRVVDNLIDAHIKARKIIKGHNKDAEVGIAQNIILYKAYGNYPHNKILQVAGNQWWNFYVSDKIGENQDFLGVNHYFQDTIKNWYGSNGHKDLTDMGWQYFPESIFHALNMVHNRYRDLGLPIRIMETGTPTKDEGRRSRFLRESLFWVLKAKEAGIPVDMYNLWTLLGGKVPEWDFGPGIDFGIVGVDDEFQRTIRPSGVEYQRLIRKYKTKSF